jgi:uncharacterized Zn finger protein
MFEWRKYVPQASRRAKADSHAKAMKKRGAAVSPVVIEGRVIAKSFWGKAWCDNLESYSDYSNRLPRGRTYARNGSVVHLAIEPGLAAAHVAGSEMYETQVRVGPLEPKRWRKLVASHASQVSSLVDLLQGRLPGSLLSALADRTSGLFPNPKEMKFDCSCPDWASMCKHVAAVLYGVGARLDAQPELFFVLRGVEVSDLAASGVTPDFGTTRMGGDLAGEDLNELFGIELAPEAGAPPRAPSPKRAAKAARSPRTARPAKPMRPTKAAAAKAGKSALEAAAKPNPAKPGRKAAKPRR